MGRNRSAHGIGDTMPKASQKRIDRPCFVVLNHPNGSVMPMVDDDDNLAMYDSEISAQVAASGNMLGSTFGYEVFELGGGVCFE